MEMGGRRFQQWVGCNFDLIKFCGDFSSVYRFLPNAQKFVSIGTVLKKQKKGICESASTQNKKPQKVADSQTNS